MRRARPQPPASSEAPSGPEHVEPSTPGQAAARRRPPSLASGPDPGPRRATPVQRPGSSVALVRSRKRRSRAATASPQPASTSRTTSSSAVRVTRSQASTLPVGWRRNDGALASTASAATSWLSWPWRKRHRVGARPPPRRPAPGRPAPAERRRSGVPGSPIAPNLSGRARLPSGMGPAPGGHPTGRRDGGQQRPGLVVALEVLVLRDAVDDDPGARLHRGPPVVVRPRGCGWRWPCRRCRRSRGSPRPPRRARAWSARGCR